MNSSLSYNINCEDTKPVCFYFVFTISLICHGTGIQTVFLNGPINKCMRRLMDGVPQIFKDLSHHAYLSLYGGNRTQIFDMDKICFEYFIYIFHFISIPVTVIAFSGMIKKLRKGEENLQEHCHWLGTKRFGTFSHSHS